MEGILFFALAGVSIFLVVKAVVRSPRPAKKPEPFIPPAAPPSPFPAPVFHEDPSFLEQKIRLESEREFVFKLNEKLSLSPDKSAGASNLVEDVRSFLGVEASVLFLYNAASGFLEAESAAGLSRERCKGLFFREGESICGEVARTRQPLMVNDLSTNSFYSALNGEAYLKHSFVSAPLVFQGELIGVLTAAEKVSGSPFRDTDLSFLMNAARVGAIAFKNSRLREQMQRDYINTITTLALLIDARDSYTKRHSENVTRYAVEICKALRFTSAQVELVRRAGLLHDIGKIGIRDSVLLKPGKLNDEEFGIIKTHAPRGAEIVATLPALREIALLVRHHHERYDGKGYPDGKKGEEIEMGARILAVADTFDAMTTDRPYRKAMTLAETRAELSRCKGGQFDPAIVDCFLTVLDANPGILSQAGC